jgi:hypothetical protein
MEKVSVAWILLMIGIQVGSRVIWQFFTYTTPLAVQYLARIARLLKRVKFPISIHVKIHVNLD